MKKCILLVIILVFAGFMVSGQTTGSKFERIKLGENHHYYSGIDISPDGKYAAVSGTKSSPFFIYDWQNNNIVKEFDVGNWFAGSSVVYSKNGSFILLQQLHYIDFAPNKDRETNFEIIDANSGATVKRFGDHHSVKIAADESKAIALSGDVISIWELPSGKKAASFTVPEAANSISISPDGRYIAVSHRISDDMAKQYPRLKKDRKARKHTTKFKQMISIYDAESFEKLFTIDSFFDIIYKLEYKEDGKGMLCLHIPHSKAQNAGGRQSYLTYIDMENRKSTRKGFISRSAYEPDFKLSESGQLLGIVSMGNRFLEIHVYDFESGDMLKRFELSFRLFEKDEGGIMMGDNRTSFDFLPGEKSVLLSMGNRLIIWDMELNK